MKASVDFEIYRGDDEARRVQLLSGGAPYDLSAVARMDLIAKMGTQKVLELSTDNGGIQVLDVASGLILLNFKHEFTTNEVWRNAKYDLQFTLTSGQVLTVMLGKITLTHDITGATK